MRKFLLLVLAASMGSLLTLLLVGLPITVSAGAGGPLTDKRFCTDADGNGRLDIGDAINILNYLFNGTATPYCVAQEVSLDRFATRAELEDLQARVLSLETVSQQRTYVATGSYIGDGRNGRLVETNVPGKIRSLRLWGLGEDSYFFLTTKVDTMDATLSEGTRFVGLNGASFSVEAFILRGDGTPAETNLNDRGRRYVWEAQFSRE